MGRRSGGALGPGGVSAFFRLADAPGPAGRRRTGLLLAVGLALGLFLGYVIMGTLDAVFEIGASRHHGQDAGLGRRAGQAATTAFPAGGTLVERTAGSAAVGAADGVNAMLNRGSDLGGAAAALEADRKSAGGGGGEVASSASDDDSTRSGSAPHSTSTASLTPELAAAVPAGLLAALPASGIHTLVTSNGSPYLNWQTRLMYQTYLMVKEGAGGAHLLGFTRILHRTVDDELVREVPTFRAQPLQPKCDQWCEYPVSDRPNAVGQFLKWALEKEGRLKARWLFMIETDYLFVTPPRVPTRGAPADATLRGADGRAVETGDVFLFHYINAAYPNPDMEKEVRKLYPPSAGPLEGVPKTGPAPALLPVEAWIALTPTWERITAQIEASEQAKKILGWVREMYAFSFALALEHVPVEVAPPPLSPLLAQPPNDPAIGNACAMHYTWGTYIVNATTKEPVWSFDKREHTKPEVVRDPPVPDPLPPYSDGWVLKDSSTKVTKQLYGTIGIMTDLMRKAKARLG